MNEIRIRSEQGYTFDPKYVIDQADAIRAAGLWPDKVFLLCSDPKERMQLLGNLLVQMAQWSTRDFAVDESLRSEVKRLAQALSYLFNSASFRAGTLYDFDKFELDSKLGRHNRR